MRAVGTLRQQVHTAGECLREPPWPVNSRPAPTRRRLLLPQLYGSRMPHLLIKRAWQGLVTVHPGVSPPGFLVWVHKRAQRPAWVGGHVSAARMTPHAQRLQGLMTAAHATVSASKEPTSCVHTRRCMEQSEADSNNSTVGGSSVCCQCAASSCRDADQCCACAVPSHMHQELLKQKHWRDAHQQQKEI